MRCRQWILVLVVALGLSRSAIAGIFTRKPKADPSEQVPALIMQAKTDKDEAKRQAAAEELRNFDPKAFPEIITVLTDAVIRDPAVGVRVEAAGSIARLSPVNQQAGFALEQAAANDPSMRVRMAARQSLWQYHLKGYRSSKPPENTEAAKSPAPAPPANAKTIHTSAKNPRNSGRIETVEPPLANSGSNTPPTQRVAPPQLVTPPANGDGPSLGGN